MRETTGFVDIHSHYLPGLDDGAKSWEEALAMARIAVADGCTHVIVTPHQLGAYTHNRGDEIRACAAQFQDAMRREGISLEVRPGADVRIDADMISRLRQRDVLTLGDHGRHVLLELPHELYFPLEEVLSRLERMGMVGILSHPERNQGILKEPELVRHLVDRGCLMQITAGSLLGTFGPASKAFAEWMLQADLTHFVATDAHGANARRPLMRRAFERARELTDDDVARQICCEAPAAVFAGREVEIQRRPTSTSRWSRWLPWRRAA